MTSGTQAGKRVRSPHFFDGNRVSFNGIHEFRPPAKRQGCEYCGRRAQPVDVINCAGCGAPLDGITYQAIEVTAVGDQYPTYLYVQHNKP